MFRWGEGGEEGGHDAASATIHGKGRKEGGKMEMKFEERARTDERDRIPFPMKFWPIFSGEAKKSYSTAITSLISGCCLQRKFRIGFSAKKTNSLLHAITEICSLRKKLWLLPLEHRREQSSAVGYACKTEALRPISGIDREKKTFSSCSDCIREKKAPLSLSLALFSLGRRAQQYVIVMHRTITPSLLPSIGGRPTAQSAHNTRRGRGSSSKRTHSELLTAEAAG